MFKSTPCVTTAVTAVLSSVDASTITVYHKAQGKGLPRYPTFDPLGNIMQCNS